jgi:hypothetical protein
VATPAADVRLRERFVGRGRELRALKGCLAAADSGRGGIVLLGGDAGIGKTRLVEELLTAVPRRRVLWGRCRAADGAPAYWPWRQIVGAYVERVAPERLRADLGDGAADLARLVPAIRGRLGVAPREVSPGDERGRFLLFDAVAELLARASADEVLAVVVDDLHWADGESLLLLRHLGAGVAGSRLLVLATYRDVEMRQATQASRILGDLARVSQRVTLRGLGEDEVAAFARNVLADLSTGLVTELHRVTDGNPFFVKQVLALLHRDGWDDGGRLPIPVEVRAAVRRRLDPLSPAVRWLLAQAAVLGREHGLGVLARLVELSAGDVLEMLSEPIALGLIAETEQPARFRFTHALVQQTLYDDLPAADRASLHRAAAGALEALGAGEASFAEVAEHYYLSLGKDALERAVQLSLRAAEQARGLLGYEEAAGHYERALAAQLSLCAPADERLPVLLDFAEVQALAGDLDGLRATCLEAARLAREQGDAEALARAALAYGQMPSLQADDAIHVGLLEDALAALPAGDSVLRARLHARIVLATYYGGSAETRAAHGREAVAIARRLGDAATEAVALRSHYANFIGTPDVGARLAILEQAIAAAERSGTPAVACEARINEVSDYLQLGDVERAERSLAAAERDAERLALPRLRWRVAVLQAVRALRKGDLCGAERASERALAMAGQVADARDARGMHGSVLIHVRRAQGRLGELLGGLAAGVARRPTPLWQALLALARAETGEREVAAALLRKLASGRFAELRVDWARVPTLAVLAEVCWAVRDAEVAAVLAPLVAREAPPVVVSPSACLGASARHRGLLAAVTGDVEQAIDLLEHGVALDTRIGAAIETTRGRLALARVLEARGGERDRGRARELLAAAQDTVGRLALGGLEGEVDDLTRRLERDEAKPLEASLHREGDDWRIACGDESMRLRDTKGVGYLLRLLAEPGREFAARELFGADQASDDHGGASNARRVDALRARARELREELAQAEDFHDLGRVAALREELEDIADALAAGLAPEAGAAGDPVAAERARLNVTRAILAVLKRIAHGCPRLGRHLQGSVRTGALCVYVPDPSLPVTWRR